MPVQPKFIAQVILFNLEREDIKILMQISFNYKRQLYFEGYDSGRSVEEAWGDSDYEYTYTIEPEEVSKFYPLFNLDIGDKRGFLQEIKKRFGVNEAYSLLGEFMRQNDIKFQSFTWT